MFDTLVLNAALKTLCREFKVERDRRCVLRLATLLIQLSKSGITDAGELVANARRDFAAGLGVEDVGEIKEESFP